MNGAADRFIGSWALVSWTVTTATGEVAYPYGKDAWGRIHYLSGGQMAACLMRRERSRFASENRLEATVPECEAAYREYLSYFGRFSVDSASGTVIHHVEAATFPNWVGSDLVRNFHFSGNRLTLSLTNREGAKSRLVWEKE